jgi:anti-sigma factor RsiW
MDTESKNKDLLLLNALVDGELAPQERAAIAARLAVDRDLARVYATLARLKASIGEIAGEPPVISLPPRGRPVWARVGTAAACVVAIIAIGLVAATKLPLGGDPTAPAEGATAITLASLPAGTTIPRLDTAGLKLIGLVLEPGKVPVFTATYRGPHGCRLDLRAWPIGSSAPAFAGTSRHTWQAGDLVYELVAHGMPHWRFAIIAEAAEQQIRAGSDPEPIDRRLRQANIGAPPCVG